ncbi:ATP-binding protein [Amycolatopsis sp. H20-H5]|uniref:ATP-binding protein n=1 Tax=Amycolatopsis sp. H20-H5 TaxID=3046309 RepID=UPI002DBFAC03|nr:ATP-binding protein [Amycolatopsis sp. H20-H5]MEC3981339.1 ATP-binding protein [Amycolatopsis sp. H20-H5]
MSEQQPARLREERRPVGRAVLAVLVTAVVVGALWVWVTLSMPSSEQTFVAIAGVITWILLCAAVFVAVLRSDEVARAEDKVRQARNEVSDARERVGAASNELSRLIDQTLPTAVKMLRGGATADTVFAEMPRPAEDTHRRILRVLVDEIAVGERRRAASTAACANAAGRVQALSTSTLAALREMENRCSDELLGDLLNIDHSTAQTGRLADSIAVLTGARSGRRWTKPIRMESILRGAMGRIGAYQRVRVHSTSGAAVAGYAAEDVMHTLAELMDNATKFSAPSEEVHVYVEDLHNGAVITIEDGGLGMKPPALARAEMAVSLGQPLDMTMLSGTRLGLAVVGCLARKHQLHVFFRPSSRGGIGVVLRIPNQLITQPRPEPFPEPEREPVAVIAGRLETGTAYSEQPTILTEPTDLPRRPRGQTLTAASRPAPSPVPRPTRSHVDTGSRFGAFQQRRKPDTDPARHSAPVDAEDDD